jgi:hypothetical protein
VSVEQKLRLVGSKPSEPVQPDTVGQSPQATDCGEGKTVSETGDREKGGGVMLAILFMMFAVLGGIGAVCAGPLFGARM